MTVKKSDYRVVSYSIVVHKDDVNNAIVEFEETATGVGLFALGATEHEPTKTQWALAKRSIDEEGSK